MFERERDGFFESESIAEQRNIARKAFFGSEEIDMIETRGIEILEVFRIEEIDSVFAKQECCRAREHGEPAASCKAVDKNQVIVGEILTKGFDLFS